MKKKIENAPKQKRRKKGEGSLFQRKSDQRWVAKVTGDGGETKRIYAATREEAIDKLALARGEQIKQLPFTDGRTTVGHWLETWLRNVRPPTTKPKTWVTYEGFVRLHLVPRLGHIRLVKLEPQHVRDFLSERLDSGLGPRSVKHLRDTLRNALNQAMEDNLIHRNAAKVDAPEIVAQELDVYTPEEARILVEAARGHRLEALFTAAIGLGLRIGECIGLLWTDIDFRRRRLTVRHSLQRVRRVRRGDVVKEGEAKTERLLGGPKNKKIESLRLPAALVESFERHRARQQEERRLAASSWKGDGRFVFTSTVGTPLEQRALERQFKKLSDHALLRRIRFHDLRHSAASILIAQGVHPKAIQQLLRHSSIQVTMDVYGHLFDAVEEETANKMDEVLRGNPAEARPHTVSDKVSNSGEGKPN
jgi:integrase